MVGDINLFFHEIHDDDSEDGDSTTPAPTDGAAALPRRLAAEFNIMIADAAHRRRGLARDGPDEPNEVAGGAGRAGFRGRRRRGARGRR